MSFNHIHPAKHLIDPNVVENSSISVWPARHPLNFGIRDKIKIMLLSMKKAKIQRRKKVINSFLSMAFISLFAIGVAIQYHKEIVAVVESVLGIGSDYVAFVFNFS